MNSYFHWTISNQLSFNRTFGDHSVNAVAVYEAEKQSIQTSQIVGTGTAGDDKIRTTKGKNITLHVMFVAEILLFLHLSLKMEKN